jgi:probable rRNA maturation factor
MSEGGPSRNSGEPPQRAELSVEVIRHGGVWEHSGISDAAMILAAHAAFAESPPETPALYEATIVLTDDSEIRELNRNWRGKDQPTNVLSFPSGDAPGEPGALGDIVIAYETARKEADEESIALEDHVSHLVVHGVLHLLGFDHTNEDEAEKMEDLERKALASIGVADPYGGDEAGLSEVPSS